jgi:hypothetical protein
VHTAGSAAASEHLDVSVWGRTSTASGLLFLITLPQQWPTNSAAGAELPRTLLREPPHILGRPVKELVLSGTGPVGRDLPPELPTTTTYKMTPNRFRPVAEDAEGVFYQALGPLQKHMSMYRGGVYMSKNIPI